MSPARAHRCRPASPIPPRGLRCRRRHDGWSGHGPEQGFAALAGVCPILASSGRTSRHRLNRGGDRQLNRALHDIALTRWLICPRTHAYIAKRRAEGKTDPEIRRCLKRHIARELFRAIPPTRPHEPNPAPLAASGRAGEGGMQGSQN
jgi:hypothetical protein